MNSKTLMALALTFTFAHAYAQSEDQVLNSDPIDVDGYLKEKNVTDGELEQIRSEIRKQKNEVHLNKEKTKGFKELSKTTEKLSDVTEEYIDEKKNTQKEIAEYNKKIKCLMEENPGPDCAKYVRNARQEEPAPAPVVQEVKVEAAAPVVSTAEVAPVSEGPLKPFEELKLALVGGVTNYSSANETLRADQYGLRAESNISERFSMNVGFTYTNFETEDFGNGQMFDQSYMNFYGAKGRQVEYKNMGFDIGGKFFVARTERFRPYVGVNLGYNMATMNYMNNDGYNAPFGMMYEYGDEEEKMSFANATIALGTEILFTRNVGMTLQGAFSRGLGSSLSSESSKNAASSPDQRRLGELADEVVEANALSITAGLMVIF